MPTAAILNAEIAGILLAAGGAFPRSEEGGGPRELLLLAPQVFPPELGAKTVLLLRAV